MRALADKPPPGAPQSDFANWAERVVSAACLTVTGLPCDPNERPAKSALERIAERRLTPEEAATILVAWAADDVAERELHPYRALFDSKRLDRTRLRFLRAVEAPPTAADGGDPSLTDVQGAEAAIESFLAGFGE